LTSGSSFPATTLGAQVFNLVTFSTYTAATSSQP
jgi:hypothetical protein